MEKTGKDTYTGWCSAEDKESNRRKNQIILEKHGNKDSIKELEKAAEHAQHFIEELKRAIEKRRSTLSTLRDLANELDSMKESSNIARATGSIALNVLTLGLASPLISVGAEIAKTAMLKDKKKKVQERLDEDKRAMKGVDDKYAHLQRLAANLSRSSPHLGSPDQIICSLLVANKFSASKTKVSRPLAFSATVCALVCVGYLAITVAKTAGKQSAKVSGKIGPKIAARLAPKMAGVFAKGTVEAAHGTIVQAVLGEAAAAAVPVIFPFDIYPLAIFHDDSETLRDIIVRGFEDQLKEMEKFLSEQSSLANDLELMLKTQFQNLLEGISCKDKANVSDEDVAEVWRYLEICGRSDAWNKVILDRVTDLHALVYAISRIFKFLKPKIEEHVEERQKKKEMVVDLTFLAHGEVRNPLLPCTLHYMNDNVMSIKLYVPWGSLLDATAAYGIATGMISINNVQYTGRVVPANPSDWNTLPQDYTLIPEVVFTPVTKDKGVYKWLLYLSSVIQGSTRGLVIPYFQPPGAADLPEVPLWALCNAVAVIGWIFNVRFKIHVASCLYPSDATIFTRSIYPSVPEYTVDCRQYCAVPIIPSNPITMVMMYDVPRDLQNAFDALNIALGSDRSSSDFRKNNSILQRFRQLCCCSYI